ncbi:hypothetical protein GGX14DRAFT_616917 [Mycena pura]|uniref:Uncharacterized protein n=1 Tax=Mycena pura TaxID=153505 RepID=A0AAD7E5S9_9AGAR|nr:hypothetical protein GGX14DRAFT_616917 [Mycena pura]
MAENFSFDLRRILSTSKKVGVTRHLNIRSKYCSTPSSHDCGCDPAETLPGCPDFRLRPPFTIRLRCEGPMHRLAGVARYGWQIVPYHVHASVQRTTNYKSVDAMPESASAACPERYLPPSLMMVTVYGFSPLAMFDIISCLTLSFTLGSLPIFLAESRGCEPFHSQYVVYALRLVVVCGTGLEFTFS